MDLHLPVRTLALLRAQEIRQVSDLFPNGRPYFKVSSNYINIRHNVVLRFMRMFIPVGQTSLLEEQPASFFRVVFILTMETDGWVPSYCLP